MELTVNGETLQITDGSTVAELVVSLKLTEGPVAVERNRDVVPRAEHAATVLAAGDTIEIVHLVGGG